MVLQVAHPRWQAVDARSARSHPDAVRIFGMAGAIALNVALLMLLVVPFATPVPEGADPPVVYPDLRRERVPPPPLPPVELPVRPRAPVAPVVTAPQVRPAPAVVPDIVVPGELATDPVATAEAAASDPLPPNTGPVAGVMLEYAVAPPPPYPRDAIRDRLEGVVTLRILVDVDGRPLEVSVHRSSGHRKLDEAARRFVLQAWRFRPAMQGGHAVQAIGLVPVDFHLDR